MASWIRRLTGARKRWRRARVERRCRSREHAFNLELRHRMEFVRRRLEAALAGRKPPPSPAPSVAKPDSPMTAAAPGVMDPDTVGVAFTGLRSPAAARQTTEHESPDDQPGTTTA